MVNDATGLPPSITIVSDPYGDWEGVYSNGKLVYQNHSIDFAVGLKALGILYDKFEADGDWLSEIGQLPPKLVDVKRDDRRD